MTSILPTESHPRGEISDLIESVLGTATTTDCNGFADDDKHQTAIGRRLLHRSAAAESQEAENKPNESMVSCLETFRNKSPSQEEP
jgi:hypothetical protein